MKVDPSSLPLRTAEFPDAIATINQLFDAVPNPPEWAKPFEVGHFEREGRAPENLADLFAHYDYGEPRWNGTLMLLARVLLPPSAETLVIESTEDLPTVDVDGIQRFFHGDVVCEGDLGAFESTWITGSLQVAGVLEASYLDAYADLFVGGDVRCDAAMFMGLSLFGGTLDVRRFAYVMSQGENWILGAVRGPALIGEDESVLDWDARHVEHHVDTDDDDLPGLAKLLGVEVEADDEYAFSVVHRAFEAARVHRSE